jgi:hypothetical protein
MESRAWLKTAGVLAAWMLSALPVLLGAARCPAALFFHLACPGCGMTRAMRLLAVGDLSGSLHMHPLAAPCVASYALFALATAWATWMLGTPIRVLDLRAGRWAAALVAIVQIALIALWVARRFGAFGGLPSVSDVPAW